MARRRCGKYSCVRGSNGGQVVLDVGGGGGVGDGGGGLISAGPGSFLSVLCLTFSYAL